MQQKYKVTKTTYHSNLNILLYTGVFFQETRAHCAPQAGLQLLGSSNAPNSVISNL